jgi:hypothetical protein
MSNIIIDKNKIDLLANSISAKSGEPLTLTLDEMVSAVDGIEPTLQTKTATYTPTESQQTETITADSGYDGLSAVNVTVNAMPSGTTGTPTATKGTVINHSVSVTPRVTNTTGYITGGTKTGTAVRVSASELVSGSVTKTANGTYDVTNLAQLVVNVSGGGGGASNIVIGEFTTGSSAGAASTTIPYTGNGYPIAAMVYIKGGAYNNTSTGDLDWYNSVQRYAVGQWTMHKSVQDSTPSYTTSGSQNQGVTTWIYKNSTSAATTYSRSSAMSANVFSSSNANNAGSTCVRLKTGNVLSYYTNTSSYGLLPSTTYTYIIIYSS